MSALFYKLGALANFKRWCGICHAITAHCSEEHGCWETLTCTKCGFTRQYKVR